MPSRPSAPRPSDSLVESCRAGDCVLYAGAGLSRQAGFPTWRQFLKQLLDLAIRAESIDSDFALSLGASLEEGHLDSVADVLVSTLSQSGKLATYLREIYLATVPPLPRAHTLLQQIPFSAVLTTNFDHLLERTFPHSSVYTHRDTEPLLDALSLRSFFLLKLYGSVEKPETVLVSPDQYKGAVARNPAFSQFIETLFFSRTLLFVGASLEGIEAYLQGIAFRESEIPARHYALVAVDGVSWRAKAAFLHKRYGIQVIAYTPSDPEHPEVAEFLSQLRSLVGPDVSLSQEASPAVLESVLTRIRLEDIGPFKQADVRLEPGWNILLGDNGVGKSSLLKAVAVALCGEDARPWAGRLVRGRERYGRIVLFFGKREYVTEIYRRSPTGLAEIRCTPTRPLETENRLALGFPPLRMVSWDRVTREESDPRAVRPVVDDLLPLVAGTPDPRLDKLKQFILKLDHQESQARQSRPGRYSEIIRKMFEVIGGLTEGLRLEFDSVDAEQGEVWVRTDDGPQRIEAVSQGTISLISWVGVLLHRLYQMNEGAEDWWDHPALVLMDEIDAHMHPDWQRRLVPRLRDMFPQIQFLATTHSPLIVSGLKPREVQVLRRDDSGQVAILKPRIDLKGLRADQILTSTLFDLKTTRDVGTEAALAIYEDLSVRDELSPRQSASLEEAATELRMRVPTVSERAIAGEAFSRIQEAVKGSVQSLPEKDREELLREVRQQLQEGITGTSRPR
jgi:hypothetical protein